MIKVSATSEGYRLICAYLGGEHVDCGSYRFTIMIGLVQVACISSLSEWKCKLSDKTDTH